MADRSQIEMTAFGAQPASPLSPVQLDDKQQLLQPKPITDPRFKAFAHCPDVLYIQEVLKYCSTFGVTTKPRVLILRPKQVLLAQQQAGNAAIRRMIQINKIKTVIIERGPNADLVAILSDNEPALKLELNRTIPDATRFVKTLHAVAEANGRSIEIARAPGPGKTSQQDGVNARVGKNLLKKPKGYVSATNTLKKVEDQCAREKKSFPSPPTNLPTYPNSPLNKKPAALPAVPEHSSAFAAAAPPKDSSFNPHSPLSAASPPVHPVKPDPVTMADRYDTPVAEPEVVPLLHSPPHAPVESPPGSPPPEAVDFGAQTDPRQYPTPMEQPLLLEEDVSPPSMSSQQRQERERQQVLQQHQQQQQYQVYYEQVAASQQAQLQQQLYAQQQAQAQQYAQQQQQAQLQMQQHYSPPHSPAYPEVLHKNRVAVSLDDCEYVANARTRTQSIGQYSAASPYESPPESPTELPVRSFSPNNTGAMLQSMTEGFEREIADLEERNRNLRTDLAKEKESKHKGELSLQQKITDLYVRVEQQQKMIDMYEQRDSLREKISAGVDKAHRVQGQYQAPVATPPRVGVASVHSPVHVASLPAYSTPVYSPQSSQVPTSHVRSVTTPHNPHHHGPATTSSSPVQNARKASSRLLDII